MPPRNPCDAAPEFRHVSQDTLYYSADGPGNAHEIFKVSLQGGKGTFLTAICSRPGYRCGRPVGSYLPDGRWLAVPLKDGGTTNIWAIPTDTDKPAYRQITDFGRQAILIARQVSWSRDGKLIYAVVAETDADIVRSTAPPPAANPTGRPAEAHASFDRVFPPL